MMNRGMEAGLVYGNIVKGMLNFQLSYSISSRVTRISTVKSSS